MLCLQTVDMIITSHSLHQHKWTRHVRKILFNFLYTEMAQYMLIGHCICFSKVALLFLNTGAHLDIRTDLAQRDMKTYGFVSEQKILLTKFQAVYFETSLLLLLIAKLSHTWLFFPAKMCTAWLRQMTMTMTNIWQVGGTWLSRMFRQKHPSLEPLAHTCFFMTMPLNSS